ncbi:inositol monophosphatase [Rhodopirellula sp.]|nr:inositol monophosphatase family protein [Rhodopirellula sp.]MDB4678763.1 inositol monophosphatase [Rhodopirellula sp.]MDB4809841.1 inositol monophosphatase [bacterium]
MLDQQKLLDVATQAANVGGDVLMRYWRDGVVINDKTASGGKSYDLVSDADLDSEKAIASLLQRAYPDHEFLGEEELDGSTDAEHLWIIDPLDGTNNYAHQIPHFAVSIAYYHRGIPEVGVVLNPARGDLYTATRGGGAFRNGQRVRVCDSETLGQTLIGCGFYYDRGEMMRSTLGAIEEFFGHDIHGIRRFGTAALDLCQVGCGQFGAFFEYLLSPWDFAAGILFVQEAGGQVTDAWGNRLPIEKTSVVASNGKLHSTVIGITGKHFQQADSKHS